VKLTAQEEEEGLALESASFPPFMLDMHEVVDSPVELPKFVTTRNEQESEAPVRNCRIRILRFCRDQQQLGVPPGFNEVLLLQLSDVWTVEQREP
jgi:hypothetical protein